MSSKAPQKKEKKTLVVLSQAPKSNRPNAPGKKRIRYTVDSSSVAAFRSDPGNQYKREARQSLAPLGLSGRNAAMARQIMLPGDTTSPILLPAVTPATMCSRIIRKNYIIGPANISADGRCAILVYPDILTPAYVLAPGTALIPLAAGTFQMDLLFGPNSNSLGGMTGSAKVSSNDGQVTDIAIPGDVNLGGVIHSAFDISFTSSTTITLNMRKFKKSPGATECRLYTGVAGAWVSLGQTGAISSAYDKTNFIPPAGARYLAFVLLNSDNSPLYNNDLVQVQANVDVGLFGELAQLTTGSLSDHLFGSIPEYVMDSHIESGRVNSVSMLVSNTSSALNKQGEIFIGRVPFDAMIDWKTIDSTMTALPANREHHGPAEFGGYAWWFADALTNSEPDTVIKYSEALRGQEFLLCYMKGLNPALSTFNVSFAWNVEFYTRNQLFEKISTPPRLQDWEEIVHMLSLVPAASCNPEHEDLYKSIIRRGTAAVSGAYEHYKKHQSTYDALMKIIAGLSLA